MRQGVAPQQRPEPLQFVVDESLSGGWQTNPRYQRTGSLLRLLKTGTSASRPLLLGQSRFFTNWLHWPIAKGQGWLMPEMEMVRP